MSKRLWVIPGFLGTAEEFDGLQVEWLSRLSDAPSISHSGPQPVSEAFFKVIDPFQFGLVGFQEWARKFVDHHRAELFNGDLVLLGYSMGGRLLLHLAEECALRSLVPPRLVFLSTNPGLPENERPARLKADAGWAQRFQKEPWSEVISAWNAQPIFQGQHVQFSKTSAPYEISKIQWCLSEWSLGNQDDFRKSLASWRFPLIWATGARDEKFCGIARSLKLSADAQKIEVSEAGHRVHLDQPQRFLELIY